MSKINRMQAAALDTQSKPTIVAAKTLEPTKKTVPAKKIQVTKPTSAGKPVVAKPIVVNKLVPKKITKAVIAKPKDSKLQKSIKIEKEKTPKLKMERDSFTMPKAEYAQLFKLKERLLKLGQTVKKSELLRAGIMQLAGMTDATLKVVMSKVPAIKTGRPKNK